MLIRGSRTDRVLAVLAALVVGSMCFQAFRFYEQPSRRLGRETTTPINAIMVHNNVMEILSVHAPHSHPAPAVRPVSSSPGISVASPTTKAGFSSPAWHFYKLNRAAAAVPVHISPSEWHTPSNNSLPSAFGEVYPSPQHTSGYVFTVGALAIFKWETPYLRNWVLYHLLLGVERIWLVSNDCDDWSASAIAVLQPFIVDGTVSLIREFQCASAFQDTAYSTVMQIVRRRRSAQWVIVIDVDEFICLEDNSLTLPDVLRRFNPDVVAIKLHRLTFGPSGHYQPPNTSHFVAVAFTLHAHPFVHSGGLFANTKAIVRPDNCGRMGTHAPQSCDTVASARRFMHASELTQTGFEGSLNSSAMPCVDTASVAFMMPRYGIKAKLFPNGTAMPAFWMDYRVMWVNHYYTKSVVEFLNRLDRGTASTSTPKESKQSMDSGLDDMASFTIIDSIAARVAALKLTEPEFASMVEHYLLTGAPSAAERASAAAKCQMRHVVWSRELLDVGILKQISGEWPVQPERYVAEVGRMLAPVMPVYAPQPHVAWPSVVVLSQTVSVLKTVLSALGKPSGATALGNASQRASSAMANLVPGTVAASEPAQAGTVIALDNVSPTASTSTPAPPAGEVSLMVPLQGDEPYLLECIEYHLLIGVSHFWLVQQRCSPTHADALSIYKEAGVVTVLDDLACDPRFQFSPKAAMSSSNRSMAKWDQDFRSNAFRLVTKRVARDSSSAAQGSGWLGFLDIHDFVYVQDAAMSISRILEKSVEGADLPISEARSSTDLEPRPSAVVLSRLLFGPSGYTSPPNGSVLASYTHLANPFRRGYGRLHPARHFVRVQALPHERQPEPASVEGSTSQARNHSLDYSTWCAAFDENGCAELAPPHYAVNPRKVRVRLSQGFTGAFIRQPRPTPTLCFHGVWVHTYATRSLDEYMRRNCRDANAYASPPPWHSIPMGVQDIYTTAIRTNVQARLTLLQQQAGSLASPQQLLLSQWEARLQELLLQQAPVPADSLDIAAASAANAFANGSREAYPLPLPAVSPASLLFPTVGGGDDEVITASVPGRWPTTEWNEAFVRGEEVVLTEATNPEI